VLQTDWKVMGDGGAVKVSHQAVRASDSTCTASKLGTGL
jgi:hypothetical protein